MRPTRILVVDDDPQLLRTLSLNLRARRYDVRTASDGGQALGHAADWHPDLIVLDLGLPDLDGVDVIGGLRGWTHVPIVVLSGRTGNRDKVDALDAGADDYVCKPFSIEELLARIRAVTRRRSDEPPPPVVRFDELEINLARKTIVGDDGTTVRLTPTEWSILEALLRDPGKLIGRQQLLTRIWGPGHAGNGNYLRVYLASLRRKLEHDPSRPRHLITEPGLGYRFEP